MLDAEESEIQEHEVPAPKVKKVKSYTCPTCGKMFTFSCNLFRHQKNIHKKMEFCRVQGCNFHCSSKRKLSMHAEFVHFGEQDKEKLKFANLEEFYAWKLREEVQNFVCYTKVRGDIKMANSTHRHYVCALSRRVGLKKKTDGKNEVYCPARLLLKESKENGTVLVTYYKNHSHKISFSESQHLPMPESLRHEIKKKLKAGLNPKQIIWELRRKHQSELAVAIGTYNRLQNFTESHILMIERMLIKKGVLKEVLPKDKARVTEEGRKEILEERAPTCTGKEAGSVDQEFVIFDGEVQEEMEVVNLPGEAGNALDGQILVSDPNFPKPKMKRKKSKKAFRSPVATPLINRCAANKDGYTVYDMFNEVKVLLCSGQVRRSDLPHIQENLQEIMDIFKYSDDLV